VITARELLYYIIINTLSLTNKHLYVLVENTKIVFSNLIIDLAKGFLVLKGYI
jgi:hypothetical protein